MDVLNVKKIVNVVKWNVMKFYIYLYLGNEKNQCVYCNKDVDCDNGKCLNEICVECYEDIHCKSGSCNKESKICN